MLRLIGATAIAYIGYRVGHRILMESGVARDIDGLSSAGWSSRGFGSDGAFEDPLVAGGTANSGDAPASDMGEAPNSGAFPAGRA